MGAAKRKGNEKRTEMVLLRVRFRPAAEELVHGGDTGFEIVLHGPEREVAADVCVEGGEHGGPLAAVFFVDDEPSQSTLFSRLDWSCLLSLSCGLGKQFGLPFGTRRETHRFA